MDQAQILEIALQQSAYDCCCTAKEFQQEKNSVHESVTSLKARKYLKLPHLCSLVSYGSNIVACGKKEILPEIELYINKAPSIAACFETPHLYELNDILAKVHAKICFLSEYFLPDIELIYRTKLSCPYELRVLGPDDFSDLYIETWENALCKERRHLDVLGIGAYDNGTLIGLAGCSADCDAMWQIGVDVLPAYRQRGIAAALTNRLARETFARGKVPFYCAAWSNVKSVKNAVRSGFKPGWIEAAAKTDAEIDAIVSYHQGQLQEE